MYIFYLVSTGTRYQCSGLLLLYLDTTEVDYNSGTKSLCYHPSSIRLVLQRSYLPYLCLLSSFYIILAILSKISVEINTINEQVYWVLLATHKVLNRHRLDSVHVILIKSSKHLNMKYIVTCLCTNFQQPGEVFVGSTCLAITSGGCCA